MTFPVFFSKFPVELVRPNNYEDGQASYGTSSIHRDTRDDHLMCLVRLNWSFEPYG